MRLESCVPFFAKKTDLVSHQVFLLLAISVLPLAFPFYLIVQL